MKGEDLYLPTAPSKLVRGIQVDSGIPLQSAAKVPIMITFNVVDRDGDRNDIKPQACIFKVNLCLSWAKKNYGSNCLHKILLPIILEKPETPLSCLSTLTCGTALILILGPSSALCFSHTRKGYTVSGSSSKRRFPWFQDVM